jgi:hypothetical protein
VNLHQIASGAIGIVNPFVTITMARASGTYTTQPDGTRVPDYVLRSGPAQVQDLSTEQLKLFEGMNISGLKKKIYLNGSWASTVRADARGGDLFYFGGAEWLAVNILEGWPDWSCVLVTMQSPRPPPQPGDPIIIGSGAIGEQSVG